MVVQAVAPIGLCEALKGAEGEGAATRGAMHFFVLEVGVARVEEPASTCSWERDGGVPVRVACEGDKGEFRRETDEGADG